MGDPGRAPIVALGGGHGLSRALQAIRRLGARPTAIVTVADDGGSSGRLRRDLGIIAPGDLRMALLALASDTRLAELFEHRFARGELQGHALGNLALVALAERCGGDFVAALDQAADLLGCAGRVLPATTRPVQLKARVSGEQVEGQARVTSARGLVEQVWLEPASPPATPQAVEALERARTVVLGPGSLFTSVIATLLVPAVGTALLRSTARVVYVANITAQPGETTGFDATAHVQALTDHFPDLRLDAVIVHDGPTPAGGEPIGRDLSHPAVARVLKADVVAREDSGRPAWDHEPQRLAAALQQVL